MVNPLLQAVPNSCSKIMDKREGLVTVQRRTAGIHQIVLDFEKCLEEGERIIRLLQRIHSTPRTHKAKSKIEYIPLICNQL